MADERTSRAKREHRAQLRRAEGEALRILSGHPGLSIRELRAALGVDADEFMGSWEQRSPLGAMPRRRLIELLDREIDRIEALKRVLAEATAAPALSSGSAAVLDPDDPLGRGTG